jgi:hypothetical protein
MDDRMARRDRSNWWLPLIAAIGTFILFVPVMLHGSDTDILYVLIVVPIISLIILLAAFFMWKRRGLAVLSMLVVYWAVSWGLLENFHELSWNSRWLYRSKYYKAMIQAQPPASNGDLKHIEWDGWGFPGAGDTVVYLVFDPNESLSAAAKNHSPGKFSGIPCKVYRVDRMESHYYSVMFYTETDWARCNL